MGSVLEYIEGKIEICGRASEIYEISDDAGIARGKYLNYFWASRHICASYA